MHRSKFTVVALSLLMAAGVDCLSAESSLPVEGLKTVVSLTYAPSGSGDATSLKRRVAPTWLLDAPFAPVFQVRDTEHKYGRYDPAVKTITLEDLIRFHGHFCGGLVEGAGALKQALDVLFPDGVVDRTDIEVATKNSACGVDVATYLTGTRVRYGSCLLGKQFKPSEFVVRRLGII